MFLWVFGVVEGRGDGVCGGCSEVCVVRLKWKWKRLLLLLVGEKMKMGDWVLTDSINAQMASRNSSAQVTVVVIL